MPWPGLETRARGIEGRSRTSPGQTSSEILPHRLVGLPCTASAPASRKQPDRVSSSRAVQEYTCTPQYACMPSVARPEMVATRAPAGSPARRSMPCAGVDQIPASQSLRGVTVPTMGALVLSRNVAIYSTRRLTEAFRSRGRALRVVDPAAICLKIGPDTVELNEGGQRLPRPEVVIPRIGVVTIEHSLSVLRHFEILRVPLTASSDAVRRSKDKMGSLQTLANAGIPIPETTLARQGPDAAWAVEAVGGPPVVLKFLTGTHGVGVFLADSAESAQSILEAMWSLEKNLIVQRYIASAAGQDLRLFVVGARVVAAMRRTAPEGTFRSNLHSGGLQCLGVRVVVAGVQFRGQGIAAEIVGIGQAVLAQGGQLLAPLRDQPVFVSFRGIHAYQSPLLRLASMNWSRSPSSTTCVLPTSTPVRKSLILD